MSRNPVPSTPTLPKGMEIASFDTYLEAQKAVDKLSDHAFAVERTTIVGTDLRMVERITGRLTYPRVALAGAMSGAWFGLFVGLLFGLLAEGSILLMLLPALLIGAAFGMLFGLVSYALTGGKRDFTSSSQVVAGRYTLLCEDEYAGQARQVLAEAGIRAEVRRAAPSTGSGTATGVAAPPAPGTQAGGAEAPGGAAPGPAAEGEPAPTRSRFQDAQGNPLYGQRLPSPPPGEQQGQDEAGSRE